jgi:tripartite ATP-independent transporter DctM subunit
LADAVKISIEAMWGLGTMIIILGGILTGVFTATESAAVACLYSFLVTMLVYKDYKWSDLPLLLHRVVKTVSMVMILIAFASAFGYIVALMQVPAKVTAFFLTLSDNKYVILMLINIMLLVLGCLMDMAPLILICTPILLPIITKLGVDPVHFGIIMIVNLGIGLLTPPVGSVLFVGCAIGKVSIEDVTRSIWPFYIVMFVVLMLVTYVPGITLWLPGLAR